MVARNRNRSLIRVDVCGTCGNTLGSVLKLMTSLKGVPYFANSSVVQYSCMITLPLCVAMASCMEKPSHMCETMAMLGMASLVLML